MSTRIQWLGQSPDLPSLQEFRKMTPAQVNQYAARFSATQRAELLRAGLAALPSCWGRRAESCAGNADGPYLDEPQCSAIMGGYFGNFDKMGDAAALVPLCQEPSAGGLSTVTVAALVAVIGVALGFAFARR
jgi:hypothetical protein